MENAVLSVLLPFFNSEHYIEEALTSLQNQTYTQFEVWAVDDGSKDGGAAIVERFAQKDPRFHLLQKENGGISSALNLAFQHARGHLIARMDADDIAHPQRFSDQLAFLTAHPEVVACGTRVMRIDPQGAPLGETLLYFDHDLIEAELLKGRGNALVHPSIVVRREAFIVAGGYDSKYDGAEDLHLFLELGRLGQLRNLDLCRLSYRQHLASSNFRFMKRWGDLKRAILAEAYAKRGLTFDPESIASEAMEINGEHDVHRHWCQIARENNFPATALKHSWKAFLKQPSRVHFGMLREDLKAYAQKRRKDGNRE